MTSMRRNDVASTSFRRHVPNRFLINQCQIITFLILKYDIIENSRIGIVLPVQVDALLGGPKGMLAPPLKLLGGLAPLAPSSYAYVISLSVNAFQCSFLFTKGVTVNKNLLMHKKRYTVDSRYLDFGYLE